MDEHGPFTIPELEAIRDSLARDAGLGVGDVVVSSIRAPGGGLSRDLLRSHLAANLARGRPVVCLWSWGGRAGHFIALTPVTHQNSHGADKVVNVEVFDPEGCGKELANMESPDFAKTAALNLGVRELLNAARAERPEMSFSYCPAGPQGILGDPTGGGSRGSTYSCGLHCLLRCAFRHMTPEEYVANFIKTKFL